MKINDNLNYVDTVLGKVIIDNEGVVQMGLSPEQVGFKLVIRGNQVFRIYNFGRTEILSRKEIREIKREVKSHQYRSTERVKNIMSIVKDNNNDKKTN